MNNSKITFRRSIGIAVFCALLAAIGIAGFSQSSGPVHRCRKCDKQVYPIDRICTSDEMCWHKWCFKCYRCGAQLDLTNFILKEMAPYCKNCIKHIEKPAPKKKNPKPKDRQIQNKSKFDDDGSPRPVEYE